MYTWLERRCAVAFAVILTFGAGAALAQEKKAVGPQDPPGDPAPSDVAQALEDAAAGLQGLSDEKVFGAESDPQAVAVVEKYLTSIGGRTTLGAITDRNAKFKNIKYSATGQTEAEIELFMKKEHLYREEWEIKGFKIKDLPLAFVQIYNGAVQEGWVQMLGTVSPLEGRTLSVFVWDKYLDDFFVQWESNGYSLHMAGAGLVDGEIECDIVNVVDFTGRQQIRYFFDKDGGRLLKKEWIDTTGKEAVKREQFYKLYRPVTFGDDKTKKILFPLKLDIFVDGDLDTERIYTKVAYNSGLSDKLFGKPEGKPFGPGIRGQADIEAAKKKAADARGAVDTAVPGGDDAKADPHAGHGHSKIRSRVRGRRDRTTTPTPTPPTPTPPTPEGGSTAPPEGSSPSKTPPAPSGGTEAAEKKAE